MKAVVAAFNQEKALVIVQPVVEPMNRFTALIYRHTNTSTHTLHSDNDADAAMLCAACFASLE